jgi:hypothetical protein
VAFSLHRELASLEKAAAQFVQEDTLRQRFVEALDHFLQDKGVAKKGVQVVLSERLIRGRPDARLGAIVFELKLPQPHGDGIEAAVTEARDYIAEFSRRHGGKFARGIAYDGATMAFLNERGEVIERAKPSKLTAKLESWLIALGGEVVDPDDFVAKLGIKILPSEDLKSRKIFCQLNLAEVNEEREQSGFAKMTFGGPKGIRPRVPLPIL